MREGVSSPPRSGRNSRIVWIRAILVVIGFSVRQAPAEWFAAFDACVANPGCNAGASPAATESYLALMIAGVGLAVVIPVVARSRTGAQRAAAVPNGKPWFRNGLFF